MHENELLFPPPYKQNQFVQASLESKAKFHSLTIRKKNCALRIKTSEWCAIKFRHLVSISTTTLNWVCDLVPEIHYFLPFVLYYRDKKCRKVSFLPRKRNRRTRHRIVEELLHLSTFSRKGLHVYAWCILLHSTKT